MNISKGFLEDVDRLKKVSTYAREMKLSTPTVYKRLESGDLKGVEIDGVKFVLVEPKG